MIGFKREYPRDQLPHVLGFCVRALKVPARGEPRLSAALRVRDEGLCCGGGALVALIRLDERIDLARWRRWRHTLLVLAATREAHP